MTLPLEIVVGQLLFVGFAGTTPSTLLLDSITRGQRGGAILFRRNLTGSLRDVAQLNATLANAAPPALPLLIAVDQEGGRVARLGAPFLKLPAARVLARGGEALCEEVAFAQSQELLALGFTMNFAPVLDVDTEDQNPIIGERAFGATAVDATRYAMAFYRGMQRAGLLGCGKHVPGHGATLEDSHLALPHVERSLDQLREIDFPPFAAAATAQIDAMMTAHVVFTHVDAERPATLSSKILQNLVRSQWGYRGVVMSDDLEMKALTNPERAAVQSIEAGADALLVCSDEGLASRVYDTLLSHAKQSATFSARVTDACERVLAMKRKRESMANFAEFERLNGAHADLVARLATLSV